MEAKQWNCHTHTHTPTHTHTHTHTHNTHTHTHTYTHTHKHTHTHTHSLSLSLSVCVCVCVCVAVPLFCFHLLFVSLAFLSPMYSHTSVFSNFSPDTRITLKSRLFFQLFCSQTFSADHFKTLLFAHRTTDREGVSAGFSITFLAVILTPCLLFLAVLLS